MTSRHRNYFFYRDREQDEVPWVRPADFKHLTLKAPVVLVNGAFDILHSPHMRLIFAARHKAGTLVCALDSDNKIAREKGPERPILTFQERFAALNHMPLDYIVEIDSPKDMNELVRQLQPDIRVQGADYREKQSRFDIPKMLVREGSIHTTEIINRIKERYGLKEEKAD